MKPRHVAIIMDGNGRWARDRGLSRIEGHREGVKRVNDIIDAAIEYGLEAITFYTFSMENWRRPRREVSALMGLLHRYLKSEMQRLIDKDIVFRAIGNIKMLPNEIQRLIRRFEDGSRKNRGLLLISALSYGGRDEIVNAVKNILRDGVNPKDIDERLFERYLYTVGIPDPDLIIRTSGEMRLSNFLIWQSAYSEFYFTRTLWPDFGRDEFLLALKDYEKRERRFGGLPPVCVTAQAEMSNG
ncbi:MAG: isoprenyl transferase [Thermodesulfovibrionia bacterium]